MSEKINKPVFKNMKWLLLCFCKEPEAYKKA